MAKSQETFSKKEKEKKRLKQRMDKKEKMEERKANARKGQSLEDMMAYIDENGNLSTTPPDPSKKRIINAEDIVIGVPQQTDEPEDAIRTGIVDFFDTSKGFGFIREIVSGERVFVHVSQLTEPLKEGQRVKFETEMGAKGLVAVNVQKD